MVLTAGTAVPSSEHRHSAHDGDTRWDMHSSYVLTEAINILSSRVAVSLPHILCYCSRELTTARFHLASDMQRVWQEYNSSEGRGERLKEPTT
jgi:hypothetical protein